MLLCLVALLIGGLVWRGHLENLVSHGGPRRTHLHFAFAVNFHRHVQAEGICGLLSLILNAFRLNHGTNTWTGLLSLLAARMNETSFWGSLCVTCFYHLLILLKRRLLLVVFIRYLCCWVARWCRFCNVYSLCLLHLLFCKLFLDLNYYLNHM